MPNRATVRPPSVSSTTPPWASTSARTRASGPEQPSGVLRVGIGEALAGLVDLDQQDGDELAFRAALGVRWPGGAGHRRSFRVVRAVRACDPSLAPPGTATYPQRTRNPAIGYHNQA